MLKSSHFLKGVRGKPSPLLPKALLVPVLLSALRFEAIKLGWVNPELGATLITVGNVLVFVLLVRALSWALDHTDTQQGITANALRNSEEKFRAINQTASDAIITLNAHGEVMGWNRHATLQLGMYWLVLNERPTQK
ncbi:hypothetical protein [Deinococcus roseus]|uniref:PAS domain-containing protein n=1 Tax=Deinococcus roseus TaxID=392414 RepID=A0ABQ2DBJ1_9DEIO|nr:hypothetical protein [Deinococcus roseus]GGJ52370.1 hypothetical protein GCM10008938_42990 [Deinococcus roseus]